MLITIRDNKGVEIMQIDDKRFPLVFDVETKWGDKTYKINVNYVKTALGEPTKKIKSVNMT